MARVHHIQAQESTDSLQINTSSDSLLLGIKFYSNVKPSKVSTFPKGTDRRKRLYGFQQGFDKTSITWDTLSTYTIKRTIYGRDLYLPTIIGFEEFSKLKKEDQKRTIRSLLVEESKVQEQSGRGLLDFKINVPGGENSAFTTILELIR